MCQMLGGQVNPTHKNLAGETTETVSIRGDLTLVRGFGTVLSHMHIVVAIVSHVCRSPWGRVWYYCVWQLVSGTKSCSGQSDSLIVISHQP